MSRSFYVPCRDDQTTPVAAGFVTGYFAFLVKDGVVVDASAITVALGADVRDVAITVPDSLDLDGSYYLVTFLIDGRAQVLAGDVSGQDEGVDRIGLQKPAKAHFLAWLGEAGDG